MERATRYSRKREAILNAIQSTDCHPSAEWVYQTLKPTHPDLSLGTVYRKNKKARVVINTITLETLAEVKRCMEELPVTEEEIVQIAVSRSKKAGRYHMMQGLNPVTVISFTLHGKKDEEA